MLMIAAEGEVEICYSGDGGDGPPTYEVTYRTDPSNRSLAYVLLDKWHTYLGTGESLRHAGASGVRGVWAELLLIAWMRDAYPGAARALLSLDDKSLRQLHRREKVFDHHFCCRLMKVLERCEAAGAPRSTTLATLLKRAEGSGRTNLSDVEARLPEWEKEWQKSAPIRRSQTEQRRERRAAAKALQLAPFKDMIFTCLARWDERNPIPKNSDSITGMMVAAYWARRKNVESLLAKAFLETGLPPCGQHALTGKFTSSSLGVVDFDELLSPAVSGLQPRP
jgi:hypothetical protein